MAFEPGSIANQVIQPKTSTGGFVPGSIAGQSLGTKTTSTFQPGSLTGGFGKGDLKSSNGLYNLAVKNGLQADADRLLSRQQGESVNKIFSGGLISDIFDGLNALQYGVTGVLKGKSFIEGVKTRQSFSDKDALGDKGIPGMIGGIALDIAVDPLTYVSFGTIPLVAKTGAALRRFAIGAKAFQGTKTGKIYDTLEAAKKAGEQTVEILQGGTKVGNYLTSKLAYSIGRDPVFLNTYERAIRNIAVATKEIVDFGRPIAKLTPDLAKKIIKPIDNQGRFGRESLEVLAKTLSPDELAPVAKLYSYIDNLGKEAVDLGLLSKQKYEENIGEYLKQAYLEFEQSNKKLPFGWSKTAIKGIKNRVDVLSDARKADRIDNPAYLLMKSAIDLKRDVENAKLFRATAQRFGRDTAAEGFIQMPKSQRYVISAGAQAGIKATIADLNKQLKPLLNELKITFKADKKALAELVGIEKLLKELGIKRGDELYKFFAEGQVVRKLSKTKAAVRGWSKLPDELQPLGKAISKFKTLQEALRSPVGIKLERAYENGVLERAGFKDTQFGNGMQSFFRFVTQPYKPAGEVVSEKILKGDMNKIIALQKRIERLTNKSKKISEIDKRSINNSFINLEKNISDLRFAKEELRDSLADAKLGDLAGKFVPEHMEPFLKDIVKPAATWFGEKEKTIVGNFKFFKVVMNPATHARNIISNQILNYWKLGMIPGAPSTLRAQYAALKEMRALKKGLPTKWIDEAKPLGYSLDTFATAEMKNLLDSPEAAAGMKQLGKGWEKVKTKLGDIYQGEENFAKLSAYIYQRQTKKLDPEAAWKAAESATFNYAAVTPFVRKLRESLFGFPFITFTYKATPLAIETALKNPDRIGVIGKIKQGIENQADLEITERERAAEPPWIKDGFYVKWPFSEDSEGRSIYVDLTYILPFGDLVSGNFFERGTNMKTGTPEQVGVAALSKSPFLNLVKEIGTNQNFYGKKIANDSDPTYKQMNDLMMHIGKTYLPPLVGDMLPGGYNEDGTRDIRGIQESLTPNEKEDMKRTAAQEVLRNFGIKVQPINVEIQEQYQEWNRQKALKTLLRDRGVIDDLNITYVPDDNK